jgi:hypothetical protein
VAAAGPFTDGSGSLFIYETDSLEDAKRIFARDPCSTGGIVVRHEMRVWQLVNAMRNSLRSLDDCAVWGLVCIGAAR